MKSGWINYDKNHLMNSDNGMIVINTTDLDNIQPTDVKGFDIISYPPKPMNTYELCLYDKLQKDLIDRTLFPNCENRDIALSRVKRVMMSQGLRLSNYGYTLKRKKYIIVDGEIKVGDSFIAFGKIDICTKVDKEYNPNEPNYYGEKSKWTVGTDCKKIIKF